MSDNFPALPGISTNAPDSVRIAATIIYGLIGLQVLRTIVTIVAKNTLVDEYLASQSQDPASASQFARDGAPAYVPIAIISLILFGLIMALLANQFSQGKNWARIVTVGLAALGALGGFIAFAQPAPIWYQLLGVLIGLVSAAVIVFLFRSDSNEYFRTAG